MDSALIDLAPWLHKRRYPAGTHIVKEGDRLDTVYFVQDGAVSLNVINDARKREYYKTSHDQFTLAHLAAGDIIGLAELFGTGIEYRTVAMARTDCVIGGITHTRFYQLMQGPLKEQAAAIHHAINRYLAQQWIGSITRLADMVSHSSEDRVIKALRSLCESGAAEEHPDGKSIHMTKYEIGRMAGCCREVTGKVLNQLATKNIIAINGRTIVVYADALA